MLVELKKIQKIARICHNVNKAYCESLGDNSQPSYDDASEDIMESARAGVIKVISNPCIMPEDIHNEWVYYKMLEGWTRGNKKDSIMKTHPCILPYNELPKEQKAKDYIFIAIVRQLEDLL